jgi:hypothetical protein
VVEMQKCQTKPNLSETVMEESDVSEEDGVTLLFFCRFSSGRGVWWRTPG